MLFRWMTALVALASLLGAAPGAAQVISVSGGVSDYDLSGTGQSWVVAARYEHRVVWRLSLEAGTGLFRYEAQGKDNRTHLFPEVGVTFPFDIWRFPFYAVAGVGSSVILEGVGDDDVTLHGGLGLSVPLGNGYALRPEMRVRSIDPWTGTMGDFTLGVSRRLGGSRFGG